MNSKKICFSKQKDVLEIHERNYNYARNDKITFRLGYIIVTYITTTFIEKRARSSRKEELASRTLVISSLKGSGERPVLNWHYYYP